MTPSDKRAAEALERIKAGNYRIGETVDDLEFFLAERERLLSALREAEKGFSALEANGRCICHGQAHAKQYCVNCFVVASLAAIRKAMEGESDPRKPL